MKDSDELTPWFPHELKPAHQGPYDIKAYGIGSFKAVWDGSCWMGVESNRPLVFQEREWRGLAKKPTGT